MPNNTLRVVVFSGSLRRESFSTKLAKSFVKNAPAGVNAELVQGIGDLPFFNEDIEENPPQQVLDFIENLKAADAFLFVTPEYNRSYTAVLKNSIDWASRSSDLIFYKKPAAVVGITPYTLGAFGAVHHLRQVLTYLNTATLQQPEFHIERAAEKFNGAGEVTDESTIRHIDNFWVEYVAWMKQVIVK